MRPDQYTRLRELSEKLADVVLEEADPVEWPGQGKTIAGMTDKERGDRYWCKKNAAASFTLLTRTLELSGEVDTGASAPPDMDKAISDAEKKATRLLDEAMNKAKKRTFDARTHGKA